MFEEFQRKFVNNFITSDRWQYIADGLITTLQVTFFAVIIGIIIGFLVAVVQTVSYGYPRDACSCTASDHLFCNIRRCEGCEQDSGCSDGVRT